MHWRFALKVNLTFEQDENSEPGVERRFTVQSDALEPEVRVCRVW